MENITLRLYQIKLPFDHSLAQLQQEIAETTGIATAAIAAITPIKRSLDARSKKKPSFVYCLDVTFAPGTEMPKNYSAMLAPAPLNREPVFGRDVLNARPVVIGCGPAGLFAAFYLSRYGYRPVIIEQGGDMARRAGAIDNFLHKRQLDPYCNYVFGEGGAGAYSDGKLATGVSSGDIPEILQVLIAHGAPPEIAYHAPPHIGSDQLRAVIARLRRTICANGGDCYFHRRVIDLRIQASCIHGVETDHGTVDAGLVVLAGGSHAEETFAMLAARQIPMVARPFQMGVRIEHPQALIDRSLFGKYAGHPTISPASYRLSSQRCGKQRQVCSFCMCPGGEIIFGGGQSGQVVTNGMSDHAKDSGFANAALVATVTPEEFGGDDALAGLAYRRAIEKQAFVLAGADYSAPGQLAEDFIHDRRRKLPLHSSYRLGLQPCRLSQLLPGTVNQALQSALVEFDAKIKDYIKTGVLAGPETRASSPIRIIRDRQSLQSPGCAGLYPAGEGAGYAGGIISAALDGIRIARAIIARYAVPR